MGADHFNNVQKKGGVLVVVRRRLNDKNPLLFRRLQWALPAASRRCRSRLFLGGTH